jgi:hypothetical protein
MAKQFLDASGLNQYTQALKNGTLKVGKAQDASTAFYASHADATGLIGIIPIDNLPQGALEKLVKVANQTKRFQLTQDDVQNGDSVLQLDTNVMYMEASGAINAGANVAMDSFSNITIKAAAAASGDTPADPVIGYALEAATAAGQLIRVKIKIA